MRKGKKIKGRPGYPGPDWLKSFMDKNSLSLKEATKLSPTRYNATKNPFIIYNYFDLLEKTIHELDLQNHAELIRNCDESGLPNTQAQEMQNNISKRAKNYAGISFFQKHPHRMIKIT